MGTDYRIEGWTVSAAHNGDHGQVVMGQGFIDKLIPGLTAFKGQLQLTQFVAGEHIDAERAGGAPTGAGGAIMITVAININAIITIIANSITIITNIVIIRISFPQRS